MIFGESLSVVLGSDKNEKNKIIFTVMSLSWEITFFMGIRIVLVYWLAMSRMISILLIFDIEGSQEVPIPVLNLYPVLFLYAFIYLYCNMN